MIKTLDRYIFSEMLGPFAFGTGTFTVLFFSAETLGGVTRMILEGQSGLGTVAEYLLNRLPQVLVLTFPMAIMLAALLAFGRLSADCELAALRASGIPFLRIALPALGFCALATGLACWLNDTIAPPATRRALELLLAHQKPEEIRHSVVSPPRLLPTGEIQVVLVLVLDTRTGEATGMHIHYFVDQVRRREIYAQSARWNGQSWEFRDVTETRFDERGRPLGPSLTRTGPVRLEAPPPAAPEELVRRILRPEELTRQELWEALQRLPDTGDAGDQLTRQRRRYMVNYHQKMALPFACLVFGLLAVPLGTRPHRTTTSIGLGICLVFILAYYVLMTLGTVLGEAGAIDPALGAWLPNAVFGAVGLLLLLATSRK